MSLEYVNIKEGVYDSTCLVDYMHCPKKFYYRWVRGLEEKEVKPSLIFGKIFHQALLLHYKGEKEEECLKVFDALPTDISDDYRTREWGKAIFKQYLERYHTEPYRTISLEVEFKVDIKGRLLAGRMDKLVDWNGQIYVVDHKTTSSLGLSFFNHFRPSMQIDGYCYACRELIGKCNGAIINGISVARQPKERFQRDISSRTEEEIERYEKVFIEWTEDIERAMEKGEWKMNYTHCAQFGRCPFWELCVYGENEKLVEYKFTINKGGGGV